MKGLGRIYKPKVKRKDGTLYESPVWWIAFYHRGKELRESSHEESETKAKKLLKKRLGEINALMAGDNFWNNREQAQKLIEEANSVRNRTEPLLKAEKQLEDLQVMVELGE